MTYKVKLENLGITKEYGAVPLSVIQKDIDSQLPYPTYLAKLDNAYRALTHVLNHDCTIELLDLRNNEAWLVYQTSLILLFIKAVHDVLGNKVLINVKNALNKGIFITVTHRLNDEIIDSIRNRMRELVEADIPIRREHMTKDSAQKLALKLKQMETFDMLHNITNIDDIEIYSLQNETQIF